LALRRLFRRQPTVRAAGGVVSRQSANGMTEVLVIHRPRYDDWSFPKGKVENGETERECAVREVREETGLVCEPDGELPGTAYTDRRGRPKTVRYWRMKLVSGEFKPNSEVDVARWVDLPQAARMLSYEHDLLMLEELMEEEVAEAGALLVRHGTAGNRKDWEGDDRLRPLDEKGRKQAEALAESLIHYPVKHVLTSPYLRCVQTVEPLARRLGLEVEKVDELAEGASAEDVARLVRGLGGELAVLCTHGDVSEEIVGPDAPNRKGGFWLLKLTEKGVKALRYVPPPEVKA
jgi:8-oxo-dGTP pyrophosphatase MutT (NUDIX family)/phosphohistidine phosphatase SixA